MVNQPPTKWEVYERILRIPYYVVFDRYINKLQAFQLVAGRYQEISLVEPRIWMPELEMGLGLWQGMYEKNARLWLRWYNAALDWIPTPEERERQRGSQAEQRASEAEQRAAQLAERLRELGVDPEEI